MLLFNERCEGFRCLDVLLVALLVALELFLFHRGEGELHRDQWYDLPVSIDICLFEREEMAVYLEAAGFEVEGIVDREPYEFEYPTRRVYAFGRKPTLSPNSRLD